jgi:MarR family transcriptional regulator, transcriptional regulator for hemolysin
MNARPESIESLIWEMRRLFHELARAADSELQTLGMQAPERALLEFLAREQEPISLSDLARKHSVSRQHIHQTLRRLSQPDWVEEIRDPEDSRRVLLRLSQKGRLVWEEIRRIDRLFFSYLSEGLSDEATGTAQAVLSLLRARLAERRAG